MTTWRGTEQQLQGPAFVILPLIRSPLLCECAGHIFELNRNGGRAVDILGRHTALGVCSLQPLAQSSELNGVDSVETRVVTGICFSSSPLCKWILTVEMGRDRRRETDKQRGRQTVQAVASTQKTGIQSGSASRRDLTYLFLEPKILPHLPVLRK